ncbi:MAG: hypothetical protein IPJ55_12695 [Chloracidobacterium sp.]|nr:hypothetical protein [Chloracidobacterium sp.]
MKVLFKVLAAFVLVCAIYFVSGAKNVRADGMEELEETSCTGTSCQVCQCGYNRCVNKGNWEPGCSQHFYSCIGGDYSCMQP